MKLLGIVALVFVVIAATVVITRYSDNIFAAFTSWTDSSPTPTAVPIKALLEVVDMKYKLGEEGEVTYEWCEEVETRSGKRYVQHRYRQLARIWVEVFWYSCPEGALREISPLGVFVEVVVSLRNVSDSPLTVDTVTDFTLFDEDGQPYEISGGLVDFYDGYKVEQHNNAGYPWHHGIEGVHPMEFYNRDSEYRDDPPDLLKPLIRNYEVSVGEKIEAVAIFDITPTGFKRNLEIAYLDQPAIPITAIPTAP